MVLTLNTNDAHNDDRTRRGRDGAPTTPPLFCTTTFDSLTSPVEASKCVAAICTRNNYNKNKRQATPMPLMFNSYGDFVLIWLLLFFRWPRIYFVGMYFICATAAQMLAHHLPSPSSPPLPRMRMLFAHNFLQNKNLTKFTFISSPHSSVLFGIGQTHFNWTS